MAEDGKYLTNNAGNVKEERAVNVSAGGADADKLLRLDSGGLIDESFLPASDVIVLTAFETLAAGDYIHIRSDGEMEKADATATGKPADGYVLTAITATNTGKFYSEGRNSGLTGKTVGAQQFLSTTAGLSTETAPSGSGNIVQQLGRAITATEAIFEPSNPYELV